MEYKTSEEWSKSLDFVGLTILDPDGWPRQEKDYWYSFNVEKITKNEFERRLVDSTIIWKLPKL